MSGVIHLLQIDQVDLVRAHRAHVNITVAAGVQRVVRLLNRQNLNNLLLHNIDDVHAVSIADWDRDVFSIRGYGALVGTPGHLYRCYGVPGRGVDKPQRVVGLDGRE